MGTQARALLLVLSLAWLVPTPGAAQSSRYCYCKSGKVHTTDSCRVACAGDRDATADSAARAKRARGAAGTRSGWTPRRRRARPAQTGVKNVSASVPTHMGGVVCVDGEVLRPKPPTQKAREFCARQQR